ncbi:MAG: nucleoside-triphosphatase [Lachnospiraceae bacterium]|nr:nucleoside-triphosphatase [Lachnospiraceae bacterium]
MQDRMQDRILDKMRDKKHIVISGAIGSGKSTLLKSLRDKMGLGDNAPGLITWSVKEKAVYMCKVGSDETVVVGEYNPRSLLPRNRMQPVQDGFNINGVSMLEAMINGASEWVTIDEIGYLERDCQPYIDKLMELFERKRVIAVVRKQDIKHINDIMNRDDALVIDLDAERNMHDKSKSISVGDCCRYD